MLPFERDLYVDMLMAHLNEEKERQQKAN
jgi:hypothetical protein